MMSVGPLTYLMGIEDMSKICLSEAQQISQSQRFSSSHTHRNSSDTNSQSGKCI